MPQITYQLNGDYFLPNIILNEPPDAEPLTKYGMMRRRFLKEQRPALFSKMLLNETLYVHCREVQQVAENRLTTILEQLMISNPPPEKSVDHLAWAAHMNMLKSIAEEVILNELIYE